MVVSTRPKGIASSTLRIRSCFAATVSKTPVCGLARNDHIHGGTILYLDTSWNMSEELVQVWVYEDTVLLGKLDRKTMQQLIDDQAADIYVETVLFPFRTDIIENTRLYPAMHVSVLAEEA